MTTSSFGSSTPIPKKRWTAVLTFSPTSASLLPSSSPNRSTFRSPAGGASLSLPELQPARASASTAPTEANPLHQLIVRFILLHSERSTTQQPRRFLVPASESRRNPKLDTFPAWRAPRFPAPARAPQRGRGVPPVADGCRALCKVTAFLRQRSASRAAVGRARRGPYASSRDATLRAHLRQAPLQKTPLAVVADQLQRTHV